MWEFKANWQSAMTFRATDTYYDWFIDRAYIVLAAQTIVSQFVETFKEFPPRQKAASFTIDQTMEKMTSAASGAGR